MPSVWVIPPPKKALIVGVADMIASNDASAEIVTHSLGSCLGVVVYDPAKRVGGILHAMLPDSSIDVVKAQAAPYMFVDTGTPRLFHTVFGLGAERQRLSVKVAGGAQFMDDDRLFNIGERNYQTLLRMLAQNGYTIHARDVGGKQSRTVRLNLTTGKVTIHSPGMPAFSL
jgi:chemotaxis protein CheD